MAASSVSVKIEMTPDLQATFDYVTSFLSPIAEASIEMHECVSLLGWDSDYCAPKRELWERSIAIVRQRRAEAGLPE